jgi:fission process protein 1
MAAWLPPFGVPLSYAVAIGYVLVDTADKTIKAYAAANAELADGVVRPDVNVTTLAALLAAERCADTVVWQLLASVFVPGFTIHTVVGAVHAGLVPLEALPSVQAAVAAVAATVGTTQDAAMAVVDKSVPTALGLAAIPFIVHPIDNAIHALLNVTLRPALKGLVCGAVGKGKEAGLELCADCGPWKKPAEGGNKKH